MDKELWDIKEKLNTYRVLFASLSEDEKNDIRKGITDWISKFDGYTRK